MSGLPSVTWEWGPGFSGPQAIQARARVIESFEIARDAESTLGMTSIGKRLIFVSERKSGTTTVGEADFPRSIWLYSNAARDVRDDIEHGMTTISDASTFVHEDFHLWRMQWFDYDDVPEIAYAEGLSYYTEYKLATVDKRFAALDGPVPAVLKRAPEDIERFGERLLQVVAAKHSGDDIKWLKQRDKSVLSRAEQLGIHIIHNQFLQNATFNDLVSLPAEGTLEAL